MNCWPWWHRGHSGATSAISTSPSFPVLVSFSGFFASATAASSAGDTGRGQSCGATPGVPPGATPGVPSPAHPSWPPLAAASAPSAAASPRAAPEPPGPTPTCTAEPRDPRQSPGTPEGGHGGGGAHRRFCRRPLASSRRRLKSFLRSSCGHKAVTAGIPELPEPPPQTLRYRLLRPP